MWWVGPGVCLLSVVMRALSLVPKDAPKKVMGCVRAERFLESESMCEMRCDG